MGWDEVSSHCWEILHCDRWPIVNQLPHSLKYVNILDTRYSEVSFSARIYVENVAILHPPAFNIPIMAFWMEV